MKQVRDLSLHRADLGDSGWSNVKCLPPLDGGGAVLGNRGLSVFVVLDVDGGYFRHDDSRGVVDVASPVSIERHDSWL